MDHRVVQIWDPFITIKQLNVLQTVLAILLALPTALVTKSLAPTHVLVVLIVPTDAMALVPIPIVNLLLSSTLKHIPSHVLLQLKSITWVMNIEILTLKWMMLRSECPVWPRWVFKMRIWAKTLIGWFWKSSLIGWQRHRVNFETPNEFNGEHYIFGGDVGDPSTGDAAGWIYQMAKIDGCGLKKMPDLPFSFTQASFSSLKQRS